MKKYLLFTLLLVVTSAIAQKTTKKREHNLPNSGNLLDMQTEVLKDIAQDSVMEGIDFGKVNNYKDMLKQANDLSPKEKKRYKQLYEIQKQEMDPKKKDSIKKLLNTFLQKNNKS